MKLYHGSNLEINNPRIIKSDRKLDFGTGFYLTSSYEQAAKWARLTEKRRNNGEPIVSVFDYDDECEKQLNVLKFDSPDAAWLRFVSNYRKNEEIKNIYDLIKGPVANDRTMPVISLFFTGVYTEEETIKRLLPQKLVDQFAFKTQRSLSFLKFEGGIKIEK